METKEKPEVALDDHLLEGVAGGISIEERSVNLENKDLFNIIFAENECKNGKGVLA